MHLACALRFQAHPARYRLKLDVPRHTVSCSWTRHHCGSARASPDIANSSSFSVLEEDVMTAIFYLIDLQTNLLCQLVCKSWSALLRRPRHKGIWCECLKLKLHTGTTGQLVQLLRQQEAWHSKSTATLLSSFDARGTFRLANFLHDWLATKLPSINRLYIQCLVGSGAAGPWILYELLSALSCCKLALPEMYLNTGFACKIVCNSINDLCIRQARFVYCRF